MSGLIIVLLLWYCVYRLNKKEYERKYNKKLKFRDTLNPRNWKKIALIKNEIYQFHDAIWCLCCEKVCRKWSLFELFTLVLYITVVEWLSRRRFSACLEDLEDEFIRTDFES